MNNYLIFNILRFIGLILLQGLIIHNMDLGMYIHPMIYPLFILLLPIEINFYLLLILSFAIGISVDIFSSTFGLNASAAVFAAYIRPLILNLIEPKESYENIDQPNIKNMGLFWFFYYSGILIFFHHFWFFILELFNFQDVLAVFLKTLISSLFSVAIIIILMYLFRPNNSKRT